MGVTLGGVARIRSQFCLSCRRILANVLFKSVEKLWVERKEGSRIDLIWFATSRDPENHQRTQSDESIATGASLFLARVNPGSPR